jgi:hypothetical protein
MVGLSLAALNVGSSGRREVLKGMIGVAHFDSAKTSVGMSK